MQADHQTYGRASASAWLGACVQALMAVLLFVYSYLARDHAAMTASILAGLGVPVWAALAIVFDQHRRERIEAFEAEAFRETDASGSSVFDQGADELRVAARRLRTLHRIFLPAVSLIVASLQIAAGVLLFISGRVLLDPDRFSADQSNEFALGAGLAVAFVGFVLARYVSGMAKQKAWSLLGAGSSQAIGTSLFALAIAIGAFVSIVNVDTVDRYLQIALPIAMIALGAEVFLNFLLDLYRPRQGKEAARAAVESRVLSMLAAPDRIAESIGEAINYQLGTDFTGNWFYRLLSRSALKLVLIGVIVSWLLSSLAVVQPHQRGIKLRFGEVVATDIGPGLHLKWMWPIEHIHVPVDITRDERGIEISRTRTATGVRMLNLGSAPPKTEGPILWTNEHAQNEGFQIVLASKDQVEEGQDLALVAVEVPVHYVVEDVLVFEQLAPAEQRDALLRATGQRAVSRYLAAKSMQEVLGSDRNTIAQDLRVAIVRAFENMNPGPDGVPRGAGVRVIYVGTQGSHPPKDAAVSFENVIVAGQNRAKQLENARKQEIETLTSVVGSTDAAAEIKAQIDLLDSLRTKPIDERDGVGIAQQTALVERLLDEAGGEAAEILAGARMVRWAKHMGARGRAARYRGQVVAYEAQPQVYRASLYFDALASMIDGTRLYVTSDLLEVTVRMNLEDINTASQNVFQSYDDQ